MKTTNKHMLILGGWVCLVVPMVFAGYACISNPCVYGVCLDDINSTYSCYCIDGYTGIQCQTNWNECWSSPCKNGGTCIDGIAAYNCTCSEGFTGDDCEVNYNECDSNPCQNNSTCIDVDNGYICHCLPGYSGQHCEIDVAVCNETEDARCENGGLCIEGPGLKFSCKCRPGWTGKVCNIPIDECKPSPCLNGGVCIDLTADYSCACHFGYTGKNCEETILMCDDNPCQNDALCLMENGVPMCYCVPDYHGDRCQYQYDECQLGPRCMNGGSCIDGIDTFSCSCPPELTGILCECLILPNNTLDCTYIRSTQPEQTTSTQIPTTTILTTETLVTNIFTFAATKTTTDLTTEYTTVSIELTEPPTTTQVPTTEFVSTNIFTTLQSTTETDFSTNEPTSTTEVSSTMETLTSTEYANTTVEEIIYSTSTTEMTTFETISTTLEISTTDMSTILPESTTYFSTTVTSLDTTTEEITTSEEPTTKYTEEVTDVYNTTYTLVINDTVTYILPQSTKEEKQITSTMIIPTTTHLENVTFFTEVPSRDISTTIETTESSIFEYTTEKKDSVTIGLKPNCIKYPCRNGGTCILTNEGPRCICKFDTEGSLCEIQLGIVNAAFSGNSYIMHQVHNKSLIKINMKAKSLSSNGLVFHCAVSQNTYMSVFVWNGMLRFQFSCGLQTMVLSEMRIKVNNGYEMAIEAQLEYTKNFSHCNAALKLNDTLSMSGNQAAKYNVFDKSKSWLHIGGLSQKHMYETLPTIPDFTGCVHSLEINNKKKRIFRDAKDAKAISECDSLACLSSPCRNEATCIQMGDDWKCLCKNGFVGRTCDQSICNNNPCLYGATCITHTVGFLCLCPLGKHGRLCEQDLEITEPLFSSSVNGYSSYILYEIPKSISYSMEMKFKFTPTTIDQISLLMFIGQRGPHNLSSDHMAVTFVKGYIMLTWNLGSGPRRIFTTKPIESATRKQHVVRIGRIGRRAWLSVDQLGNITGRSPGRLVRLDTPSLLYIGGHESTNFSWLPHDLPLHVGFAGCISEVELRTGQVTISLLRGITTATAGRAVAQCGTNECSDHICQNGGACLQHGATFMCLCADGWYGQFCSLKYNMCDVVHNNCSSDSTCVPLVDNYECDCPLGKTGKFCEKSEVLSDIHFSGKRSYLSLYPINIQKVDFIIDIQIRPLQDRGLILFTGYTDGLCFLSLYLQGGILEFRIVFEKYTHNEVTVVRSGRFLNMGEWHKIRITRYGKRMFLWINDIVTTTTLNSNDLLPIKESLLYLGGLPDLSKLPQNAASHYPVPFKGCMRQLIINNKHIPLHGKSSIDARNVNDCDGTPCGGDVCINGGTCWLDSSGIPHCACAEQYTGSRCQNRLSCLDLPCRNYGRCVVDIKGVYKCTCPIGFYGNFCEQTAKLLRTPQFDGDGFLVLNEDKISSGKKRNAQSLRNNLYLYVNFSTVQNDGMLLWTGQDDHFIGLGFKNGYIQLAWAWYATNTFVLEAPGSGQISDGNWHNITINLNSGNISIRIDSNLIHSQANALLNHNPFIDSVLYIGGFPPNRIIQKETKGLFKKSFNGCIQELAFSEDTSINDFSNYSGENLGICSV